MLGMFSHAKLLWDTQEVIIIKQQSFVEGFWKFLCCNVMYYICNFCFHLLRDSCLKWKKSASHKSRRFGKNRSADDIKSSTTNLSGVPTDSGCSDPGGDEVWRRKQQDCCRWYLLSLHHHVNPCHDSNPEDNSNNDGCRCLRYLFVGGTGVVTLSLAEIVGGGCGEGTMVPWRWGGNLSFVVLHCTIVARGWSWSESRD